MQFSPSIYEHAAALIGKTPRAVSRSADLLFQAHAKAFHLYNHDPVVVGIDIYNVEAEAYGAAVSIPESNDIPAISGHACPDAAAIRKLKPLNPNKIILFGSYATGNAETNKSDLDLVVVTNDNFIPQNYNELMEIYLKVSNT